MSKKHNIWGVKKWKWVWLSDYQCFDGVVYRWGGGGELNQQYEIVKNSKLSQLFNAKRGSRIILYDQNGITFRNLCLLKLNRSVFCTKNGTIAN